MPGDGHMKRPSRESLSQRARVCCLLTSLLSAALLLSAVRFVRGAEQASSIQVQYRALIDDSVYGHSGRSGREVLNQLALTTPTAIARKHVTQDLRRKMDQLAAEIDEGKPTKEKEAELARIQAMLDDDDLLQKEIDHHVRGNQENLALLARLARRKIAPLLSDVEPVCEPAAFVLNDALAQFDPGTVNVNLTEL